MVQDVSLSTGLVILAMTLVTVMTRWMGFYFMHYITLGPRLEAGFASLPGAVVAATIAPLIIRDNLSALAAVLVSATIARIGWNDAFAVMGGLLSAIVLRIWLG